MIDRKMEIITQLMSELEDLMEPGADELGERLGRPKVEVAIEQKEPMDGDEFAMEGDLSEPDMELKKRLLDLRG